MLEREELLSDIVKRELVSYRKILKSRISWGDRVSMCLYVAALIPFISLLVLVLLSKLTYDGGNIAETERLVSAVYAVGGIVAALTGMLIAILAIAAQVNSLYIGGSESLFRVLISKTHYRPVAALAVGTIMGALVGCMYNGSEPYWILFSSVLVLVCFGSATAFAELMVLFRAVESFGREAAREMFVNQLKEDNRRALLVELKRRIAWNVLINKLKEMGFEWSIWETKQRKGQVRYCVKKVGRFVSDVKFEPLRRLARKWGLKPISDEESDVGFLMGEQERPIVCIRPGQQVEKGQAVLVVGGEKINPDIQKLIENAFICRRRSPFDGEKVKWDDFGDMVRKQLKESNARELRNMLISFYGIVEDYMNCLEEVKVEHPKPNFFGIEEYQPPTLEAIGFREIVTNIKSIRDRSCLRSLIGFVRSLCDISFGVREGIEYYSDVLRFLGDFYFFGGSDYEFSSDIKQLTVESLRSGAYSLISPYIRKEKEKERIENVDLVLKYTNIYYTELCGILSSIWRTGDEKTFNELLDQLNLELGSRHGGAVNYYRLAEREFEYFKKCGTLDDDLGQKAYRKLEFARMDVEIQDLRYLGDLAVSAWLAEVVGAGKMDATKAKTLAEKAISHVSGLNRLIEAFLYASSVGSHDSPLGYGWWELEKKIPGKVYSSQPAFEGWIQPFWILVVLKKLSAEKQIEVDVKKIRLLSAFRDYHYEQLQKAIEEIVSHKEKHEWFVGDIDWENAKEKLLKIFQEIKEVQRKMDFERLLTTPISQTKVDKLKKDCLKGYLENRKIASLIKEFKLSKKKGKVNSWSNKATVVHLPNKEEFIEEWHVGYGGNVGSGDFLGQVETRNFSYWIEKKLPELGVVNNFIELPSRVKEVADELHKKGFIPTVVLIPEDHGYQDTFASTIDREPMSEYMKNDLPEWIAEFDDMQVFIWPRCEQECIAVIDIDKFLAVEEESIGTYAPLEIQLNEINEERMQELLGKKNSSRNKQCQKEFKASGCDLASFAKIKLDLKVTANVRLGIVETEAGAKLMLDRNTIGIVCDNEKMICHTLDCSLVEEIAPKNKEMKTTAAFAWRRYHFKPCDECMPLFGHT
jgi:hypothetical protein